MELCAKSPTPHLRLFLEFFLPALQYWWDSGFCWLALVVGIVVLVFAEVLLVWLDSGILACGLWGWVVFVLVFVVFVLDGDNRWWFWILFLFLLWLVFGYWMG